jgi:hypothetical protein
MGKRLIKISFVLIFLIIFVAISIAQRQTGTIKGIITDNEGNILPAVQLTVTSTAMMNSKTYVSAGTGVFRFVALSPGEYTLKAEMAGFKTVIRGSIIVRVGMVVTLKIAMEITPLKEEILVSASSPVIDLEQTKITITADENILRNTPLARDLYDIVNSAPGAVSGYDGYMRTTSIHGSSVRGNTYALDGVNMNDPATQVVLTNVNYDVMEEVEMIVGAHPAEVAFTDGAYINVVTRSGGDEFSGGAFLNFTNDSLVKQLWSDEEVQTVGLSRSHADESWFDGSLSLGGPILSDRLWFFSNIHYIKQKSGSSGIPYTDPYLGRIHYPSDWSQEEKMGFLKLTLQLTSKIKIAGMFNVVERYQPKWDGGGLLQASRILDHERAYIGNGIINYILDQNTVFEIKLGYVQRWLPYLLQEEARGLPRIRNFGALYNDITTANINRTFNRRRFQAAIQFIRFQDNYLGGSHEFKGGLEFEDSPGGRDIWRKDNLLWYWSENSPYYYGTAAWKGVPNVGKGRIYFYVCGAEEGSTELVPGTRRIGAYIQDSATFLNRLTLNLGLRFDRSWGWFEPSTKGACGNPVSIYVGENYVKPYTASRYPQIFPDGINPFGELSAEGWKDILVWNSLSPRIGLTFDILGDGKTVFKAAYSRYTEYLMKQHFVPLDPVRGDYLLRFDWYDMNFNQKVDTGDDFTIYPMDYRAFDPAFLANQLDPEITPPLTDEFTVGIWQELFKNFSLGVNFIYKKKKNILEDGLYNPDTGEWWYHIAQPEAKMYWIPFTAIVPSEDYGDRTVKFYVRKNDAPDFFYRISNLPELERKYWALELLFNKRMADRWQFSGSVVYSKAYGNIDVWYSSSSGWSDAADDPNEFVNTYGRLSVDRPLQIKLMGTARLPYNILLSTYYWYSSGSPWVRNAYITPPGPWCLERNAFRDFYLVNIDDPNQPQRSYHAGFLNLRIEKEFRIGDTGRIGVYVDASNVLGYKEVNLGRSDVMYYYPVAKNDNTGSVTQWDSYKAIRSLRGARRFSFSIRFTF